MLRKIGRLIAILVVFVMICECLAGVLAPSQDVAKSALSMHAKGHGTFLLTMLAEKTEESEKGEEEKVKFCSVELVDFLQIATLLSRLHSPHIKFEDIQSRVETLPSFQSLFCTLLI